MRINVRALFAELVGTFGFVFLGVGAAVTISQGGFTHNSVVDLLDKSPFMAPVIALMVALAHGFAIAVMATATSAVSGGHLNPAVTFAFVLTRKISVLNGVGYIIAQIAGAGLASRALRVGLGDTFYGVNAENPYGNQWGYARMEQALFGMPSLGDKITSAHGMMVEAILTFILVFVIFGTAYDKRAPKAGGLYIGLTVAAAALAFGPITGAVMNPARWFGSMFSGGLATTPDVYLLGPIIGASIAALFYVFMMEPRKPLPVEAEEVATVG